MKLYRPVAAMMTFFSIRYSAVAADKKEIPVTISPIVKLTNSVTNSEKITISGIVTDKKGLPLENAEVRLNEQIVAKTDKNGHYEFELNDAIVKSFILVISYPDLTSTVRSYHPAMLSTSFDVVLEKLTAQGNDLFTMGAPVTYYSTFPSENICFKNNVKLLDDSIKNKLSRLATWMRNNPEAMIKIVGYLPFESLNKARQSAIKNHLVNIEGISDERISLAIERVMVKEMKNTLEVVIDR